MRRLAKYFVPFVLSVAIVAACGSDASDDASVVTPGSVTDNSAPEPSPAPPPDAGDQDPDPDPDPDVGDDDGDDEPVPGDEAYIALTADGIDTDQQAVSFGDSIDDVLPLALEYWGPPDADSGEKPPSQECLTSGDTFRRVEWGDTELLFIDGVFDFWFTTDSDQNTESFVGDSTTVSIFSGHTTVSEIRAVVGEALDVTDDDLFGPSFFINDNFGELSGELTDLSEDAIVQSIRAGVGCGE